jgi:hypothetical protein
VGPCLVQGVFVVIAGRHGGNAEQRIHGLQLCSSLLAQRAKGETAPNKRRFQRVTAPL